MGGSITFCCFTFIWRTKSVLLICYHCYSEVFLVDIAMCLALFCFFLCVSLLIQQWCAERGEVWRRWLGHLATRQKKSFRPQNNKSDMFILTPRFLTGRKHVALSLRLCGTRILRLNREMKLTKTVQKLSTKFMVRPKGGGAVAPSPLNTPL